MLAINYLRSLRSVKSILFMLASIMLALAITASTASAQQSVQGESKKPQKADIQSSACTGANLEFTTTPDKNECKFGGVDATDKLNDLIAQIINIFSVIVGVVAVIMIIVGGFRYITSGGDTNNVNTAKNTVLYAIIGLIVVAFAQFIVKLVLSKAVDIAS